MGTDESKSNLPPPGRLQPLKVGSLTWESRMHKHSKNKGEGTPNCLADFPDNGRGIKHQQVRGSTSCQGSAIRALQSSKYNLDWVFQSWLDIYNLDWIFQSRSKKGSIEKFNPRSIARSFQPRRLRSHFSIPSGSPPLHDGEAPETYVFKHFVHPESRSLLSLLFWVASLFGAFSPSFSRILGVCRKMNPCSNGVVIFAFSLS